MTTRVRPRHDPFADVPEAQRHVREGVLANAELLRPELLSQIGDTLGGLNSIGALRSGGTKVALDDVSRDFTDRIGSIASASTLNAVNAGLEGGRQRLTARDLRFREDEAKRARKSALLGAIGKVLGAGVGFAIGGPPGAAAGVTATGSGGF